jgi:hypothetical protein
MTTNYERCVHCCTALPKHVQGTGAVHSPEACRDVLRKMFQSERDAKRRTVEQLLHVVEAGMAVALLQPAAYAKDQAEADKWTRFYTVLNEAPVGGTFIDSARQSLKAGR